MILRALIVDDEPPARRRLKTLLASEPSIVVAGEAEDGVSAITAIESLRPDLVFLDVQMPGADGFEVLAAVDRQLGRDAPGVVFVTAFDEYALRAFDAHAVDYLLKPFDRKRLHTAVVRAHAMSGRSDAIARLLDTVAAGRPLQRLLVRDGARVFFLPIADIDWIEAAGHYVTIHVGRGQHLIREPIGALIERLPAGRFARIHRSTVVNVDRIRELRTLPHGDVEVHLRDGTRLHASRTYGRHLRMERRRA